MHRWVQWVRVQSINKRFGSVGGEQFWSRILFVARSANKTQNHIKKRSGRRLCCWQSHCSLLYRMRSNELTPDRSHCASWIRSEQKHMFFFHTCSVHAQSQVNKRRSLIKKKPYVVAVRVLSTPSLSLNWCGYCVHSTLHAHTHSQQPASMVRFVHANFSHLFIQLITLSRRFKRLVANWIRTEWLPWIVCEKRIETSFTGNFNYWFSNTRSVFHSLAGCVCVCLIKQLTMVKRNFMFRCFISQ